MKLIIVNRTHWKTAHLRPFITRALRHERSSLFTRAFSYSFRCIVKYNRAGDRHSYCSGHAPIGGNYMTVMLPSVNVDKADFAMVCFHEAAHTAGLRHDAMRKEPLYHRVDNWRELYSWAEALPLEKVLPQRRMRPDANQRLLHARSMLTKALTRERRATTIRKRWERRIKTLEKTHSMLAEAASRMPSWYKSVT